MNKYIFKIYGAYQWNELDKNNKSKKVKCLIITLSNLMEHAKV